MSFEGKSNVTRPELFARNRPFEMKTTRHGAQVPDGWVAKPDYLGPERRYGERRTRAERREENRVGDGRVQRRVRCGRRHDEKADMYYTGSTLPM